MFKMTTMVAGLLFWKDDLCMVTEYAGGHH